ncbi:MAG: dihydroneopterin aldolase [Streptococcaceae bacterium]|nr:dihydroneopterin aldolase [Streptococcaceae bacterium]
MTEEAVSNSVDKRNFILLEIVNRLLEKLGILMDKIRINNMKFWTYSGVLPEEQKLGQPIAIDLELRLDLSISGKKDDLTKTIDYAEVHQTIVELVTNERFQLMEALAYRILDKIGKRWKRQLHSSLICIHKQYVPMSGIFDDIEIEMEKEYK